MPGGFTALQTYGGLQGCTDQTRDQIRRVDAAFNVIHGTGPQLAALKNPIKSTIERITQMLSSNPVPVIKVNLLNNSKFSEHCFCLETYLAPTGALGVTMYVCPSVCYKV